MTYQNSMETSQDLIFLNLLKSFYLQLRLLLTVRWEIDKVVSVHRSWKLVKKIVQKLRRCSAISSVPNPWETIILILFTVGGETRDYFMTMEYLKKIALKHSSLHSSCSCPCYEALTWQKTPGGELQALKSDKFSLRTFRHGAQKHRHYWIIAGDLL